MDDEKPKTKALQQTEEEYVPGIQPREGHGYYSFTLMEITALEEYVKDLDMTRACAVAGYSKPSQAAERLKRSEKIRLELEKIHDVWRKNMLMNTKHASAKHIELMQKFEKDYDTLPGLTSKGESTIKGQLASTLGKMSSDYMKAAGSFDSDDGTDSQIVINIDMGDGDVEVDDSGKKAKVTSRKSE